MSYAYVTLMCGGDGYLAGVEALGRSLVESGSLLPRVVMVTSDVTMMARQRLIDQGWRVHPIEPISSPNLLDEPIFARYARTFTKIRAFELEEHDKVVFLDADTLVLSNIDELFERPSIAAAPDFFMPDRFNSGVMVLAPSRSLFADLLEAMGRLPTYDGGDQGLLNAFWPNWWSMPAEHRLGARYNLHHFVYQFMMSDRGLRRRFGDEIKVVHYTLQKPWQRPTFMGGAEIWWDKFYGVHPEAARGWRRQLHALQDRSFGAVVGMLGG